MGMTKIKVIHETQVCNRYLFCLDVRETNLFAYSKLKQCYTLTLALED